ncbi:DNA translocase FtsK [Sphingomonas sp. HF-S3]|uniref:DNA translocase FtsK n=1 Tax=Sphingomonas rustica TaxID=3103142 RepID=A0ABV0B3C4_9SPHN
MTVVIPPGWQQPRPYSELNYLLSRNLVIVSRRASGSFVARSLGIGFNEAMNHLDRMERAGVISAADERGVRSVLARPLGLEPDEAGKP